MDSRPKIVNIDSRHAYYAQEQAQLAAIGADMILARTKGDDDIIRACADADIVLVEASPVTAKAIGGMARARAIIIYAVGYDKIDVAAATRQGIIVANIPDYCTEEVSDHTAALLLAASRRVVIMDRNIRAGGWFDFPQNGPIHRMKNLTLGIVGLGRIGSGVVRKLSGFHMRTLVADPYLKPADAPAGVELVPLERVLRESDLISVHVPLGPQTRGMFSTAQFRAMKPTAIFVNTSRGPIVDEEALATALREKWIAGAALDVTVKEPLDASSPLRGLDHLIITPHYGASSEESVPQLRATVMDSVRALLAGHWPPYPVNPSVLPRAALKPWSEFRRA